MSVPDVHVQYEERRLAVAVKGAQILDSESFRVYLCGPVRERLEDVDHARSFEDDLRGLVTTGMASDVLAGILASTTVHEDWQVGEALAECLLEDIEGAVWPWNTERDKRTPKASLPGADMIGFVRLDGQVFLLLGETKTSSAVQSPPNVMTGRTGMIQQLDRLATETQIHRSLLTWLHARCKNTVYWPLYQEAARHYLNSGGKALVLYGLLMRDTLPTPTDLATRANALSTLVSLPTRVSLQAWYLPSPIRDWPLLVQGGMP